MTALNKVFTSNQAKIFLTKTHIDMVLEKLRKYLDDNHVEYIVISHSQAFTAQKIAAAVHIKGKNIAKTVMIVADGKMAMAVLPANDRVDFELLQDALGVVNIWLPDEKEFKDKFPNCETGAMPPFGNFYDMDVYVSESLTGDHEIAFNAGSHTELVQMQYSDFERLVKPKILNFTVALV